MGLTRLSIGQLVHARGIRLLDETGALDPQADRPSVRAELSLAREAIDDFLYCWLNANTAANTPDVPALSPVMEALIHSVDGTPHDGRIPGVGEGWDFYNHGVIQRPRDGRLAASGWVSFQENAAGNPGGLSIETRNFQQWALDGSNKWIRLTGEIRGSQIHPIPPHEGGVEDDMGTGPVFKLPRPGVGSQAWSWQHTLPAGTQGIVTLMEVRLFNPPGGGTNLLVATGGDWYPYAGSPGGTGIGACVGRYIAPTLEYRWCGARSLPEAVLRDHPLTLV
mgnify:CR=1 FL=1